MLDIKCDKCGQRIEQPGALLFSPPMEDWMVRKYHLCVPCYKQVFKLANLKDTEAPAPRPTRLL